MSAHDISVSFPAAGVIRVQSRSLFGDAESATCRRFLERVIQAEEISNLTITDGHEPRADLHFCPRTFSLRQVINRVVDLLGCESASDETQPASEHIRPCSTTGQSREPVPTAGRAQAHHHSQGIAGRRSTDVTQVVLGASAGDKQSTVRFYLHESLVTNWQIKSELPGRLRLKNPILFRKSELCQAIERELMGVLGIDRFSTNSITCTVLVHYDPRQLTRTQVIEILDAALAGAEQPSGSDDLDMHLPICTASLPLAASAQFVAAPLLVPAAALYAFTSIPTFKEARRVFVEEKRIGVDALDAVVMVGCLGTMSIFPGAVCCWCLSFGRFLVKQSRDRSQKLLTSAFGKQPRYVWLCRGEAEIQVPTDKLQKGDVIVVHTGEVVPVDGHVVDGHGSDRPARVDRRVDAGRKGNGRPGFCLDVARGGRDQGHGRDVGKRDGLRQDRPDLERHGGIQDVVAAQRRAAGRQGRAPDPGCRGAGHGDDGPLGRRRGAQ